MVAPDWYALLTNMDILKAQIGAADTDQLKNLAHLCLGTLFLGLSYSALKRKSGSAREEAHDAIYRSGAKELLDALTSRPDCAYLADLINLRDQGWKSPVMEKHFPSDLPSTWGPFYDDLVWARIVCCDMMRSMDRVERFVRTERFLDIGCCPGGFSTYVLQKCPDATGLGISLPVSHGGLDLSIPQDLHERIEVLMMDMSHLDLAPSLLKPKKTPFPALTEMPFTPHTFDLVICDSRHLDSTLYNRYRTWNWTRTLISQLLLGLHAVSEGGTMFLQLSRIEKPVGSRVLLALCRIANYVSPIKPTKDFAYKGSYYVVVRQVCVDSDEYRTLVTALEKLWYIMSFEGRDGYGRRINWDEMDTITCWEDVMSDEGQNSLARLGRPVWRVQRDALRDFMTRRGALGASS